MITRTSRLAIAFLLLSLGDSLVAQSPRTRPEEVGLSSERLQRLTQVLRSYVDQRQLPGGVAMVLRRGKVAYLEAFGSRDMEAREPMRPDTIFRIASQTKAIVSVGVMMLQEDGRLLIGDRVDKYLPEFRDGTVAVPREGGAGYDVVKAKEALTIRHLLTHTAGIGYGNGPAADRWKEAGIQGWYFAGRDEPVAATVARMAALPLDAQPGERWVYGYAIDILGVVIERVSGQTLDRFLQERILGPLKMVDTHFYLPRSKAGRLAVVYSKTPGGALERAPDPGGMIGQGAYVEGPRKSFSGGAGLLSTANDYGRFLQMLLNGGELDGVRILSPSSVELMTVDHAQGLFDRPGEGFGLGFSVVKDLGARGVPGSVGEFGWGGAYHSTYWVDPREQLIVLYLTQVIPTGGLDDYGKLRALVYQAIID
ncbi:MAG TPA: serine hydrolase domain-containing protein [Vicinamibacterales bacterium]|nr:serine hydrolase domain-containing protein [Vicinamibacterales bacterium]